MADDSVQIIVDRQSIGQLQRALRKAGDDCKEGITAEMRSIADRIVGDAQQRVPWVTGAAAQSLRARGRVGGASMAAGGTAAPYYPWLDFGGRVGRNRSIKREWRGRPNGSGRYIYPAISAHRDETITRLYALVKRTAEAQDIETQGF